MMFIRRYLVAPLVELGLRLCDALGNPHMQPEDRERINELRRLRKTGQARP